MPKFSAPVDLQRTELRNAVTQNLASAPASPLAGLRYYDTPSSRERYWDGTRWVDVTDAWVVPTTPVDFGGQTIINLGAPTAPSDGATKGYVDSVATGLDVKDSVRAASLGDITVASPGATIDGVTLGLGDRVLLKNQTAPAENGIYTFNGAGVSLTRAADADSSAEVTTGMFALVVAGTQTGTGWILTTPDPIVLGTTALTFAQFSAAASYIGTPNRIIVTGNQIDIAPTYAGQISLTTLGTVTAGTWQATPVGVAYGGTGATTAAGARSALGAVGKYAITIGTGATSYTITHALGTSDVIVRTYEVATNVEVFAELTLVDANNVRLDFGNAPTAGAQVRVVVIG